MPVDSMLAEVYSGTACGPYRSVLSQVKQLSQYDLKSSVFVGCLGCGGRGERGSGVRGHHHRGEPVAQRGRDHAAALFNAAAEQFSEAGYHAASLSEIVVRAGLSARLAPVMVRVERGAGPDVLPAYTRPGRASARSAPSDRR
jgi:hypothetical protein